MKGKHLKAETIHITRWGDSGPKIVLVHGSAQGSSVGGEKHFAAQRPIADQGWQLIIPDRPGHGQSASLGRPDDAEADGIWVSDLLGNGAHLVGHSFGGCVALAAAARRPNSVYSLTLIEPGMHGLATDNADVRRFIRSMIIAIAFSFSARSRAKRFSKIARIPAELRSDGDRGELRALGRGLKRLKVPPAATLRRELKIVRESKIPLLVITGGWNKAFDVVGERVASLGGGHHQIIKSPHHFPQMISSEFNTVLMDFMSRAEHSKD